MLSKIIDYIWPFLTYVFLALWIIGTSVLFFLEMIMLFPFVIIDEAYARIKNLFKK